MKLLNKISENRNKIIILFFIVAAVLLSLFIWSDSNSASVNALSKRGSQSQEVTQIQTKLKQWGYYDGEIDGIYGSQTEEAVKYFQSKNGLTVDGIAAGVQTLKAIGISSTSSDVSYNASERNLLIRIISAEARGEPYEGQVAVGAVIMNRVKHPSFPNTLSGVIYQPGAFTAIVDGQFNEPVDPACAGAADAALSGVDPSGGAIYYYNPAKTTNQWIYSREVIKTIGNHVFAK